MAVNVQHDIFTNDAVPPQATKQPELHALVNAYSVIGRARRQQSKDKAVMLTNESNRENTLRDLALVYTATFCSYLEHSLVKHIFHSSLLPIARACHQEARLMFGRLST